MGDVPLVDEVGVDGGGVLGDEFCGGLVGGVDAVAGVLDEDEVDVEVVPDGLEEVVGVVAKRWQGSGLHVFIFGVEEEEVVVGLGLRLGVAVVDEDGDGAVGGHLLSGASCEVEWRPSYKGRSTGWESAASWTATG